jgi:membrane-associated phospholipid phosphatase
MKLGTPFRVTSQSINQAVSVPRPTRAGGPAFLAGACLAAAVVFALLALAVAAGAVDAVDSYSVHHLMPWFTLNQHGTSFLGSLLSYHGRQFHATLGLRLPAGIMVSSALMVLVCAVLWRRGDRKAALLWLGGFVAANAVVVLCKAVIQRPDLYVSLDGVPYHEGGFDNSFPSGHALRAGILVATAVYTWPMLSWLALPWLAAVVLTLELNGSHTPSDILGGLLLACTIGTAALALRGWTRKPVLPVDEERSLTAPGPRSS